MNDKKLKEMRGATMEKLDALFESAKAEERNLKPEEVEKAEAMQKEVNDIDRQIEVEYRHAAQQAKRFPEFSSGEKAEVAKFSLAKFLRQIDPNNRTDTLDGIERELADEGNREAREAGLGTKGIMLPQWAFETRDMTATGGSGGEQGGMTVQTDKYGLLDDLFNRSVLGQAGATILTNLVGNIDIPRLVKGTEPAEKAESGQATEYTATTAQVSMSPNRLPTVIEVSNQLLKQSNERALQTVVQRHLSSYLMQAMQKAALHGRGKTTYYEPTGLASVTGIGSVAIGTTGGAPTYAAIVDLQKEVAIDDADMGALAFITNAKVEAKLKTVAKISSTDSFTVLDSRMGTLLDGKPYFVTNSVSSALTKSSSTGLSAIFYGNWRDLWIAQWGGIEFLINPYSKDDYGLTRINASVYYDVAPVRPVSFAACLDISA